MIAVMSNFEQNHRIRQRVLLAVALVGLGLLFLTFLTAGGPARAETVAETGGETVTGASAQAQTGGLDEREALAAASAYLSSLENMQGDFLQVGPDGSVAEGKFYLRRPGRLRFEYEPPENLLVVADGTWVAVKDSSSPAQRYPLASTPLNLLLGEDVDRPKLQLRQWVVTDVQGLQTTVALRNIERGIRADNSLFVLRDEQRPRIGPR